MGALDRCVGDSGTLAPHRGEIHWQAIRGEAEHPDDIADLLVEHLDPHAPLLAGVALVSGAAAVVGARLDPHRRTALGTAQQSRERVCAGVAADARADRATGGPQLLHLIEELRLDDRVMECRDPCIAVRQLANVEAVPQHRPDRVFRERVLPAVPGRPVAGAGEGDRHPTIREAVRGQRKRHPEPLDGDELLPGLDIARPGNSVRDRHATVILRRTEGEEAVVEPLLLAFGLALFRFRAEVVRVVLGEGGEGGEDDLPDGRRKVHVLGDRDEADAGALEALQSIEGHQEVSSEPVQLVADQDVEAAGLGVLEHPGEDRAAGEIVGVGRPPLIGIDLDDVPPVRLGIGAAGTLLGTEAVSLDLFVGGDTHIDDGPEPWHIRYPCHAARMFV